MNYEMQKKNRDEEKVFSVTMTEEELSLFSEFLEQKKYSKLSEDEKEILEDMKYMTPREKEKFKKKNTKEKVLKRVLRSGMEENGASAKKFLSVAGTFGGGGAGLTLGFQHELPRTAAFVGATAGNLIGKGVGYTIDSAKINKEVRRYREDPENPMYSGINETVDKYNDLLDVSEGKKTEEDYLSKWGSKSSKKNKKSKE